MSGPSPLLAQPPARAHAASKQRKRGPPSALHIDTPSSNSNLLLVPVAADDDSAATSAVTSASTDDSEAFQFPPPQTKRTRNMKKLSLSLSSAQSSTSSLLIPQPQNAEQPPKSAFPSDADRPRRLSVVSLPAPSTTAALLRKEEDGGSPSAPYVDGPIEILPKIWLGSEDNGHNWQALIDRGIGSVLNVAKEVVSPFDSVASRPLRPISSTPNLKGARDSDDTYYPPHKLSGRPGMHYCKLQWSHGQSDLVQRGFADAMTFVDKALGRGEGILIQYVFQSPIATPR
jgi:tyrosine-protein phosphatase MSG5